MPQKGARADEDGLLAALQALYRDADALFQGATCEQSSECCRFGITGREPQVTSLELALVQRAIRARGGPLSKQKRALPMSKPERDERVCPLLDRGSRCSIYASRPLGCRTFFCGRAEHLREPTRAELSALVRRLQLLSAAHMQEGDKPRALTRALS
jgi:Fe-S-cluster containining protein